MKKTTVFLAAALLVGVAYVGTSWYVGKEAQIAITDAVTQANERAVSMLGSDPNYARFHIEIRDYDRGLFSSSAQYAISTVDSEGQPLEYILHDHLQHGPFPLAALSAGEFSPMLAYSRANMVVTPAIEKWFDAQQGSTPLTIETRVGFGGNGTSFWTFAPFETSRDDQRVSFSGGYLQIEFAEGFNDNVARGHFDVYAVIDSALDEKVEIRDISLHSASQQTSQDRFEQQSSIKIKTLAISGAADTSPIVIDDLAVDVSGKQEAEFLDGQLQYDAARIMVDDNDLGQMTLSGSVARLNIQALAELQATYLAMAQKRGPDTDPGFTLTDEEQITLQNKLRPFLSAGPVVAVDSIVWKTASGESRASVSVAMQDPGQTSSANMFEVLRELISNAKLDVGIERSMVVGLFEQVGAGDDVDPVQAGEIGGTLFDEYAQLLTEMSLARMENDTLTVSLDVSPGENKVVFNDEALTVDQLMMRLMWLVFLPMP